jgi:hypothetical protein
MDRISEHPLSPKISSSFAESNEQGARLVDVDPTEEPSKIVGEIDGFVDVWQTGKRPTADVIDPRDIPYVLGSLWAEQLIRQFGWQWVELVYHQAKDVKALAVVSPDRSLLIRPIDFLMRCLADPNVDVTIELAFNALLANARWPAEPGAHLDVMQTARRLVPRR